MTSSAAPNDIVIYASDVAVMHNFFPADVGAVGFVDRAGGNCALSASSPYKRTGTDGTDIGFRSVVICNTWSVQEASCRAADGVLSAIATEAHAQARGNARQKSQSRRRRVEVTNGRVRKLIP